MAVGLELAVNLRRKAHYSLGLLRNGALFMIAALGLSRFSTAALDGLPTLAAAILTVFAATTSLLYNRARAYTPGPLQRRTLHAAEQCLRATLLLIIGVAWTSVVFYWLPAPTVSPPIPMRGNLLTFVFSLPAVMMLAFAGWLYIGVLQTLLPPMISPLRARRRFRRELERRKRTPTPG